MRAHEDNGWTRVLFAYGSSGPEPAALAAYTAARLQSIELLLAHRPNVSYPTYAAKTFATLDQLSGGRLSVHFITGGNDHEQGREGDTLTKDERYARTQEYIQIVKQAWSSAESFDHQGPFYDFDDFVLDAKPFEGRTDHLVRRVVGRRVPRRRGRGRHLRRLGRAARPHRRADRARARRGRRRGPHDAAAHPRRVPADRRADRGARLGEGAPHPRPDRGAQGRRGGQLSRRHPIDKPENAGSQRLLEIAAQGERFDTALWTATAKATGGAGNSNALVGTPEQVAEALLAYYDLGVRVISARGYDLLDDAVDFGRYVIPLVREEVAKRDAAAAEAAAA